MAVWEYWDKNDTDRIHLVLTVVRSGVKKPFHPTEMGDRFFPVFLAGLELDRWPRMASF